MLATTTKYALRALLYLAGHGQGEFIQIKNLSEQAGVPGPYLAKIIKTLAAKDLVETKKGYAGGVRLELDPGSITFLDVCRALDDPIVSEACLISKSKCRNIAPCAIHEKWGPLRDRIHSFLLEMKVNTSNTAVMEMLK